MHTNNNRSNNKGRIKRNRRRNPNQGNGNHRSAEVGSSLPLVPVSRYLKKSTLTGNLVVKTVGQLVDVANNFVVAEARLLAPSNPAMSGGTGIFTTVLTGLLDFSPYALGRVNYITTKVMLNTFEATNNLHAVCFFSDTQPTTVITTYALALSASTNYLQSVQTIMGVAAGDSKSGTMTLRSSTKRILRDNMISDDRDFVATLNPIPSPPNQEVWLGIVLFNTTALNIASGVSVDVETVLRLKAFSRLPNA